MPRQLVRAMGRNMVGSEVSPPLCTSTTLLEAQVAGARPDWRSVEVKTVLFVSLYPQPPLPPVVLLGLLAGGLTVVVVIAPGEA